MKRLIIYLIILLTITTAKAIEIPVSVDANIPIGPFVDTNANYLPSLTIPYTNVFLTKYGGTSQAAKADTAGLAYLGRGVYNCHLTGSTDVGTLGWLRIDVNDINGVPVWKGDIMVVSSTYWNWKYGSTTLTVTEPNSATIVTNQSTLLVEISKADANRATSDATLATKVLLSATDTNVTREVSRADSNRVTSDLTITGNQTLLLNSVSNHDANMRSVATNNDANMRNVISTEDANLKAVLYNNDSNMRSVASTADSNLKTALYNNDANMRGAVSATDANLRSELSKHDANDRSFFNPMEANQTTIINKTNLIPASPASKTDLDPCLAAIVKFASDANTATKNAIAGISITGGSIDYNEVQKADTNALNAFSFSGISVTADMNGVLNAVDSEHKDVNEIRNTQCYK